MLKAATIHAPSAVTHIASLPSEQAVDVLHRRLHTGIDTTRRPADMAMDVLDSVRHSVGVSCEHCRMANATRFAHPRSAYKHPGQLISTPTSRGHSKCRPAVSNTLSCSSTTTRVTRRSTSCSTSPRPSTKCGPLSPSSTPSSTLARRTPPRSWRHFSLRQRRRVPLQGLRRDARPRLGQPVSLPRSRPPTQRRAIMANVRANIEASSAPISFWPHLVEHAVDCLNRPDSVLGPKRRAASCHPNSCCPWSVRTRATMTWATRWPPWGHQLLSWRRAP